MEVGSQKKKTIIDEISNRLISGELPKVFLVKFLFLRKFSLKKPRHKKSLTFIKISSENSVWKNFLMEIMLEKISAVELKPRHDRS